MELQAQVSALEEEVGMLKGEIKAILQEVRVAILARQNPFLADDLERSLAAPVAFAPVAASPAPAAPAAAVEPVQTAHTSEPAPRVVKLHAQDIADIDFDAPHIPTPRLGSRNRALDLAALMVWVQDSADRFSHTEFVMLVTMASYADFFDEGLKQALLDMSQQVAREPNTKASLADFSLALKKLESISATTGRNRQAA